MADGRDLGFPLMGWLAELGLHPDGTALVSMAWYALMVGIWLWAWRSAPPGVSLEKCARSVQNIPKCRRCPWKYSCGGGCTARVHSRFGTIHKESHFCRFSGADHRGIDLAY